MDPWGDRQPVSEEHTFSSNFNDQNICGGEKEEVDDSPKNLTKGFNDIKERKPDGGEKAVIIDDYSIQLEAKLKKIQKKNESRSSGKDMLNSLKTQRESFMSDLLATNDDRAFIAYTSNNASAIENPTFFENLYQTNAFYRHINPQQALETSEKIPIVYHDQLARESTDSNGIDCSDVVKKPTDINAGTG